ncbi:MAG TPA: dTDP-4-dehydrorhamnose 3,5-epimerase, partial [Candidatus Sericytochromatia bacterium]
KFTETKLKGAYVIEVEPVADERGFFARSWCQKEFAEHGLNPNLVQCNISFNLKKGTLRGMHYQAKPYQEAKLIRCTRGAIYQVVIDIRPDSLTFKQWVAVELTTENRKMLYVPKGMASGFQTLMDNTEVFYQMAEFYHPESAKGLRWDDPTFGVEWPNEVLVISAPDRSHSLFNDFVVGENE